MSPPYESLFFSIMVYHRILKEFPVLYSRTLSFIHSICNSLHWLIPNPQSFPPAAGIEKHFTLWHVCHKRCLYLTHIQDGKSFLLHFLYFKSLHDLISMAWVFIEDKLFLCTRNKRGLSPPLIKSAPEEMEMDLFDKFRETNWSMQWWASSLFPQALGSKLLVGNMICSSSESLCLCTGPLIGQRNLIHQNFRINELNVATKSNVTCST